MIDRLFLFCSIFSASWKKDPNKGNKKVMERIFPVDIPWRTFYSAYLLEIVYFRYKRGLFCSIVPVARSSRECIDY